MSSSPAATSARPDHRMYVVGSGLDITLTPIPSLEVGLVTRLVADAQRQGTIGTVKYRMRSSVCHGYIQRSGEVAAMPFTWLFPSWV
jgi:hypothetical protein